VERPKISVKAGVSELKFSQERRASECLFLIILFMSRATPPSHPHSKGFSCAACALDYSLTDLICLWGLEVRRSGVNSTDSRSR
ncbi:mCG1030629, partial [Mus musculus]